MQTKFLFGTSKVLKKRNARKIKQTLSKCISYFDTIYMKKQQFTHNLFFPNTINQLSNWHLIVFLKKRKEKISLFAPPHSIFVLLRVYN